MEIAITHNPDCGTSRNVLKFVQDAGYTPQVILYLETGWTAPQLLMMFAAAGVTAREALRRTKSPAERLGLLDPTLPDDILIASMLVHPIFVTRPFVATPNGTRLCRPMEAVLDLFGRMAAGDMEKTRRSTRSRRNRHPHALNFMSPMGERCRDSAGSLDRNGEWL